MKPRLYNIVAAFMKKWLLLLFTCLFGYFLSAQNFNPVKTGYTAIDTLHISEYTYFNSVYFINDSCFVYYDLDPESTDETGTRNFYIGVYNINQKKIVARLHNQFFELRFVVSPSGKHLVVFDDKGANFYKINGGDFQYLGTVTGVSCAQSQLKPAFSKSGNTAFIPCGNTVFTVTMGDKEILRTGHFTQEDVGIIWSVALSENDEMLALGCGGGIVKLYKTSHYEPISSTTALAADVTDIVYSKEKSAFLCVSGEGIASLSTNGEVTSTFDLGENSGDLSTLSIPYNGYFIVGSFDYPHKLISVENALKDETFLNKKNYLNLENTDWPDGGLYFDYRAVAVSPGYKYIALALPWRDIVILKLN